MPLDGFLATFKTDVIIDEGVVYRGAIAIGAARGISFDPGKEVRNVDFPGKRAPVAELDRVVGYAPKISFSLMEFGDNTTGGQIALVEPGSTQAAGTGGVTTATTPVAAGSFLGPGAYVADLRVMWEQGDGEFIAVHFPSAFCTRYSIKGQDKAEGSIDVEFEARLPLADAITNAGSAPYAIERRSAVPS